MNESNGKVIQLLLVEDNPGDARFVQELLREHENGSTFEVLHVDSLQKAMQMVRNRRFDAVLIDLSLPDSSGLSTFSKLKNSQPDLPTIILTGLDDEEVAKRAITLGAHDYLPKKHLDGKLLLGMIHYAVDKK